MTFLEGQIRNDKRTYPGIECTLCQLFKTECEQWIEVGHHYERHFYVAPRCFEFVENPCQAYAFLQSDKTRTLNGHAVGHRI